MRRLRDDSGATAILIAILFPVVLLGMGALVIDAGSLYSERRQLQNGADAGALAVAQICAGGTCDASKAAQYADSNSKDGASNVQSVCGNAPGISLCATTPSGVPSGAHYVQVTTQTGSSAGPSLMPPILAKALVPSYNGKTVTAKAVAAYGSPAGLTSGLPVTISKCEWDKYTSNGTVYGSPTYPAAMEHVLYLHTTAGTPTCKEGPSGADLPGGFGWLATTDKSTCTAYSDVNGTFPDDPGVSIDQTCKAELDKLIGTIIYIPIYDELSGTGSGGSYGMAGFAAFYLTGWALPGTHHSSIITGIDYCKGTDKCLYGVFTKQLEPTSGSVGAGGASLGVNVVQLVG